MFKRFKATRTAFKRRLQFTCALVFSLPLWLAPVFAVTPSPAMIEQFKQLPRAQQEQLAKQYGIDMSQLESGGSDDSTSGKGEPLQQRSDHLKDKNNTADFNTTLRNKSAISSLDETADFVDANQTVVEKPKALERFGLNLFDANISTFAPVDTMPVPENYILGPDDHLQIQSFGKESSNKRVKIDRDGIIQLDGIGPMEVAGLTFQEASELIKARISEANIGIEAAVSMGKLRTINVFVAGEAKYPGMYAVSAMTSVTQALFVAGGVSDIGSLRHIKVTRGGTTVAHFDLYDLLLRGDNSGDQTLKHGDVVFISPINGVAEISGEVNRPAIYEIKAGETVSQLLDMAGGHKPKAHIKAVTLQRINQQNVKDLKTLDLTNSVDAATALQAGDSLVLSAISNRIENEIVLAGAVVRPGRYAYKSGMQLTDVIRGVWSDLLPTVDLDYALVLRELNRKGDIEVIQLNLADVLGVGITNSRPMQLQPRDIVLVFHYGVEEIEKESDKEKLKRQKGFTRNLIEEEKPLKEIVKAKNFVDVFSDDEFLAESAKLTRQELLEPVLQKLRRQASNSQPLAIASVFGDVKIPGDYPLAQGSGVRELVVAAGGVKDSAYLQRAELSRYDGQASGDNQMLVRNVQVNLAEVLADATKDVALKSRDRLNVFSMPDWSVNRMVTIEGEVRFPGTYQVEKGETLSALIARAGGFTENAFPFGAVFTREKIQEREQAQYMRLLNQLKADIATKTLSSNGLPATATPEQSMALIDQLAEQQMVGRLVINMTQIEAANPQYDIEVEQGDKLYIPRQNAAVSVVGEVQHPGTHSFDERLSVEDYLALSGNSRKRADDERVYVLRADGSVVIPTSSMFGFSKTQLMPGDTIVVPLDIEYKDNLSLWTQITQIFYQSAVALAAIKNF